MEEKLKGIQKYIDSLSTTVNSAKLQEYGKSEKNNLEIKNGKPFKTEPKSKVFSNVVLETKDGFGRYLAATRDINPGEVIFVEPFLVVTPKCGSGPTCLNCFKNLPEEDWPICDVCKCPKCSEKCTGNYHTVKECEMLSNIYKNKQIDRNIDLVKQLNIILTVLRTHLSIKKNKLKKYLLKILQNNVEIRNKTPLKLFIDKFVVKFITEDTNLPINCELIHHICGVFDTNAFDINIGRDKHARGLLPASAFLNHSCVPNTQHWFFDDHCIVKSCVFIRKGEPVTNTYTQTLWGTNARLKHLRLTKCFTCTCPRCSDPTELNTHFSSIECQSCKNSENPPLRLPNSYLLPVENQKYWQCLECGVKMSNSQANSIIEISSSIVATANEIDVQSMLNIISRLESMVGSQHNSTIKLMLCFIRKVVDDIEKVDFSVLIEALKLIDFHLNDVMSKLEPGLTKFKGSLLLDKLKIVTSILSRISNNVNEELCTQMYKTFTLLNKEYIENFEKEMTDCADILEFDETSLSELNYTLGKWKTIKNEC